jgi:hypothetical protein
MLIFLDRLRLAENSIDDKKPGAWLCTRLRESSTHSLIYFSTVPHQIRLASGTHITGLPGHHRKEDFALYGAPEGLPHVADR